MTRLGVKKKKIKINKSKQKGEKKDDVNEATRRKRLREGGERLGETGGRKRTPLISKKIL